VEVEDNETVVEKYYKGTHEWLPRRTLLLAKGGSQAYGTNTPESDLDVRGICVAPPEYYLGFAREFEQAEQHVPFDLTIFDLKKFMRLATECNPNIVEMLWQDPDDYLVWTRMGSELLDQREAFLSKRAQFTFSSYALSQLKRINTHRRWLLNPPQGQPSRAAFGLPEGHTMPKDQLDAVQDLLHKKVQSWELDLAKVEPSVRLELKEQFEAVLSEVLKCAPDDLAGAREDAAARSLGLDSNFLALLGKERAYRGAMADWKSYTNWQATRNAKRAALEAKHGYDCYAEDTEFLTDNGWKLFDVVAPSDKLATVFLTAGVDSRPYLGVEYQAPTNKFDARYNGPMYRISGQHTDALVTANHRMLTRKVERESGREHDWVLDEASVLPDSFDVLVTPTPRTKTYSNKEVFDGLPIPPKALLALMGWYLSDGCAAFREDTPRSVRISQILGGKLSWHMARWQADHGEKANSSLYEYARSPNSYNSSLHVERVLDVRHPAIVRRIIEECGFKDAKRIPRWVLGLSKNLMERLIVALIRGDGTRREHKTKDDSFIYYSKSKALADDVQELGLFSGWETSVWGPYSTTDADGRECPMYQVHLRKLKKLTRRLVRSANVERVDAVGQRIVCFTVPNGTLITRRNGKVAIHGNCKHGMHLVRLMRMCLEILTEKRLYVKRPDAEELKSIRNGAWSYERLAEWAVEMAAKVTEAAKVSTLPEKADRVRLDALTVRLVERSFTARFI
jgi:predicted nucleotidyltransferase